MNLQDHYEAIERLRRNDNGSALMMRELERILGEFKWDVYQELQLRRVKELGKDKP